MLANSDMNFTSEDPDNFLLNTPNANVTLHRILMLKVKARARHAFTLKQKNLF